MPDGVSHEQAEIDRAVLSIRRVNPNQQDKTIAKYIAAGFLGNQLSEALSLAENHNTTLAHIVRWNTKKGLSMSRIRLCLGLRDSYGLNALSVTLISRFLNRAGMSEYDPTEIAFVPDSVLEYFSTFTEIAGRIGGNYPVHRVWHTIDELYAGNVQAAYHLALEREDLFIQVITRKISPQEAANELNKGEGYLEENDELGDDLSAELEALAESDPRTFHDIQRLIEYGGN